MCRWNAYYGQPIVIDELLYRTEHGLIDQSLHARQGVETTNGDGFGIGWYGAADGARRAATGASRPRGATPTCATSPRTIESPLFLAHIRATTGTPVQQTNCHPFRHGRWLFVHNGVIAGFHLMRRDLTLGGRPGAVRRDRRLHRLGDPVLPRADVRARGRSAGRRRAGRGLRRGHGARARRRAPRADDARVQRRRAAVGRALLVRAPVAHAVRVGGRGDRPGAAPGQPALPGAHRRDEDRRVRAPLGPARRLGRGAGVDGAHHSAGRRRAPSRSGRRRRRRPKRRVR